MDAYFRVARQKIADRLGFMCAQVVADDVNGAFWSLTGDVRQICPLALRSAGGFLFGEFTTTKLLNLRTT